MSKSDKIVNLQKVIAGLITTISAAAALAAWGAYVDVQKMKPKVEDAVQTKKILCEVAILNNWKTDTVKKTCVR